MSVCALIEDDEVMHPKMGDAESMELYVQAVSGSTAQICTSTTASPKSFCDAIEKYLGISSKCQRWLLGEKQLAYHNFASLADIPLKSGDHLTVVSVSASLVPLADAFELELRSTRDKFRTGYSSAFNIVYHIKGVISEGWIAFEPWRKNDHDEVLIDTNSGIVEKADSHWMAGTTCTRTTLNGDPLSDIVKAWSAAGEEEAVPDSADRFWLSGPCPDVAKRQPRRSSDESQTRPDYTAVPGWFVAPSDGCIEVEADIPLPMSKKKIIRLLLNRDGEPLLAAVQGCKLGGLHEDIEEYVIRASFPKRESMMKPSPQNGQVS